MILIHEHLFLRWIKFDSGTSFVWDILRLKYWIIFYLVNLFGNSCFPYVRLGIWANLPIFTNICKNGPYGPFLHGNRDVNHTWLFFWLFTMSMSLWHCGIVVCSVKYSTISHLHTQTEEGLSSQIYFVILYYYL